MIQIRIILRWNLKFKITCNSFFSPFFLVYPVFIQNWFDFESTKYIIKEVLHREFMKGKNKTVNEFMQNYSSSNPARDTTTCDAH